MSPVQNLQPLAENWSDALKAILVPGLNFAQQQPSAKAPYSPFGVDSAGLPVEYAVVRSFKSGDYGIGNCRFWENTDLKNNHCGVDLVSYADAGLQWVTFSDTLGGKNTTAIRVLVNNRTWYLADLRSLDYYGAVRRRPVGRIDQTQLANYKFQYPGLTAAGLNTRRVYAIADGEGILWSPRNYSLWVRVSEHLIIHYIHLIPVDHVNPASFAPQFNQDARAKLEQPFDPKTSVNIKAGQLLGQYAQVGSSDFPHLHIQFTNLHKADVVNYLGGSLPNGASDLDAYVDPINPVGNVNGEDYGLAPFALWTPPRKGALPERISTYGKPVNPIPWHPVTLG